MDTSPEAWQLRFEAIKAMPISRRIQLAIELTEVAHEISKAGAIRRQKLQS